MFQYDQPDATGHFRHAGTATFGGSFVSETLVHALDELKDAYAHYRNDPAFVAEYKKELAHFVGRPSPIYHAERLSRELGGAQIYLKREDLNHTGAHKINNVIGQALLAKRMGKPRVIAETGAGQHGVATATICARYGLECVVYMGSEDVKRQSPNVYRMKLLGATVVPVDSGSRTLKDALNEAMRDWVTNVENTFYIIGTVAGPHPYPMMVRDFQRRHRRRMPGADARHGGPPARRRHRLRGRWQQCHRHLLPLHPPRGHAPDRRRSGGRGHRQRQARRDAVRWHAGRAAWQPHLPAARTPTARSPRRTRSPRAWTTPASARSTPT